MRRAWTNLLALIVAAGLGCRPAAPPAQPAPSPAPRPLITIVVDQLGAWLAAERWPRLPADGGFARLRREGRTYVEMRYAHAVTDTAPGHAALYTGAAPRDSGIFGNEVPSAAGGGKTQSILVDASTREVGVDDGVTARPGASLARLRLPTLADLFVAQVPGAAVVSLSLKDRGALFGGGRKPLAALWLDTELAQMVTSTAFPPPPAWARRAGGRSALGAAMAAPWSLEREEAGWVAAHAETPDDQPGEGDYAGLGVTFPHPIRSAKALRATPAGDELLLALAREAVAAVATDRTRLLLALSLSSHDYVTHVFGPHSWEEWDELLRLDRALAGLLAFLDDKFGRDGYDVMLTADHGSVALPEVAAVAGGPWCARPADVARWQRTCAGRRLLAPELAVALEQAYVAAFGPGPWLSGLADPLVFFSAKGAALAPADRARAVAIAKETLGPLGVSDVVDVRATAATCGLGEAIADLVCRSVDAKDPGDLYLVVAPGALFDPGYTPGQGMSHGSPYLHDRAVPLIVRAPGRVAPGEVYDRPVSFKTFARTAAALLGLAPQSAWAADPEIPGAHLGDP
jgi:arylsulfatase A-like enzyme